MHKVTGQLIENYYRHFNANNLMPFLALLTEDVVHDLNQSSREVSKKTFRGFMERMGRCYRESITDIEVMTNASGDRAASEYVVHGDYLKTDEGLPEARGQHYRLAGGAFFEIRGGLISRVSNYYNLQDWLKQVG